MGLLQLSFQMQDNAEVENMMRAYLLIMSELLTVACLTKLTSNHDFSRIQSARAYRTASISNQEVDQGRVDSELVE